MGIAHSGGGGGGEGVYVCVSESFKIWGVHLLLSVGISRSCSASRVICLSFVSPIIRSLNVRVIMSAYFSSLLSNQNLHEFVIMYLIIRFSVVY